MKIYQVDSFTDKPFMGNPAGVCILDTMRDDAWMKNVAREINASETAFLLKRYEGFELRWFTPATEVELCGHATLATAHILWEKGYIKKSEAVSFHTRSGILTAQFKEGWIELDFPALPEQKTDPPAKLMEALGVKPVYVGKNKFDYLVEIEGETNVRGMKPNFALLSEITARGVIVTAKSTVYDFVSRFFAPAVGIDEDPVTGSAHCCLGPYWMKKLSKNQLFAQQVSERGGTIKVQVNGNRVLISGKAVTVIEGELYS